MTTFAPAKISNAAFQAPSPRFIGSVIVLLGLVLRAWNLQGNGYNSDEIRELKLARAPLTDLILDRDKDRFPPLHRTLVGVAIRATGSDAAARWLSVACGVLTVVVAWRAGATLLGEREAPWPALIMACSPYHIFYCREGRAYALYMLLAALMFWGALRLLRGGGARNWLLLIGSSAAAVFTHYYAAPLVIVVWLSVTWASYRRDGWREPLIAGLVMTLLLGAAATLLWLAMSDVHDEKLVAWFDVEALGFTYVSLATGFSAGPSINELRGMSASEGVKQFLPWIVAIGVAYATLGWQALRRLGKPDLALLLTPMLLLVPALGVLGNLDGQGFVFRYVCWLTTPYALLLGTGASCWRRSRFAAVGVVILLAVNAISITNRRFDARYAEEDFRALAAKLDELDPSRGPVLVASDYAGDALAYYTAGERSVAGFSVFSHHAAQREAILNEFLASHPSGTRFLLVSQWLPKDDVRRDTRDAALARFHAEPLVRQSQIDIYSAVVP
jgi:hypothetical protein